MRRILFLILGAAATARGARVPTEYDLKAVFIFHFTQFVAWPDSAFSGPDAPFVIGIVGSDPFGPALTAIVRGESVGRHPVVVRHVSDLDAERNCQLIYVSEGGEAKIALRDLDDAPILTVGESADFSKAGGIIRFLSDRRHVRLMIDLGKARSRSLVISGKLLRVAEVIDGGLMKRLRYYAVRLQGIRPARPDAP